MRKINDTFLFSVSELPLGAHTEWARYRALQRLATEYARRGKFILAQQAREASIAHLDAMNAILEEHNASLQ